MVLNSPGTAQNLQTAHQQNGRQCQPGSASLHICREDRSKTVNTSQLLSMTPLRVLRIQRSETAVASHIRRCDDMMRLQTWDDRSFLVRISVNSASVSSAGTRVRAWQDARANCLGRGDVRKMRSNVLETNHRSSTAVERHCHTPR